jgi:Domain of unknown function (DUF4145)
MQPEYRQMNVTAMCPDCGFPTTFERSHRGSQQELGQTNINLQHDLAGIHYSRIIYRLFRCSVCQRGSLAKLHDNGDENVAHLEWFYPNTPNPAKLPASVPEELAKEVREAELAASVGALRAASALLRSALEKALKANGYVKGNDRTLTDLQKRIDAAADDGIITAARQKKAHADVRALGNDVLHDDWREVTRQEVDTAHHYVQRILEDFYDDRPSVEAILIANNKLSFPAPL